MATLRDYAEGRHQLRFASTDYGKKYGQQLMSLRENLCAPVVAAFSDALKVESWGPNNNTTTANELGLARILDLVHDEAFRCGDAFVLVWPGKDNRPVPHFHRADEIVPHADPIDPSILDFAVKIWVDDDLYPRANIYRADRVYRYYGPAKLAKDYKHTDVPTDAAKWVPYELDGEPADADNPYGVVPVCWWANESHTVAARGRSILVDVIPLQDVLNKAIADMVITAETYARPFRYICNYIPPANNTLAAGGNLIAATMGANTGSAPKFDFDKQQLFATSSQGPVGQLPFPDLSSIVTIQKTAVEQISRVVGLPPFYFGAATGDIPSAAALRVLSSRMSARVERFQRASTPPLKGLAELLGMQTPEIIWAPVVTETETELLDNAIMKQTLGYSFEDILAGLGEADIQGIITRANDNKNASVKALGKAFSDGNLTP